MLKYELKKLFTSRFVIAMLIMLTILTGIICVVNYHEYTTGVRSDAATYMLKDKSAVKPFTVTEENIFDLIKEQKEIAADDSNYEWLPDNGGATYRYGKYESVLQTMDEIASKDESLTEEEIALQESFYKQDPNGSEGSMLTKQITNTRYYYIWYMIEEFLGEGMRAYPEKYNNLVYSIQPYTDKHDENDPYVIASKTRVTSGIVCDLSFGWDCIIQTGYQMLPSFMAIIVAIGSILLFTSEYTGKIDTLIMSTKNGRRRVVLSKLLAGIVFSGVVVCFFTLVSLCFYAGFFTLRGANASCDMILANGKVATYFQAFLIMIINQFFSLVAICFSSFAISSFVNKTLLSVIGTFGLILVPFVLKNFVYTSSEIFSNVISALPINALNGVYDYPFYESIFGRICNAYLLVVPVALIIIMISLPFVPIGWRKHQVSV